MTYNLYLHYWILLTLFVNLIKLEHEPLSNKVN